MLERHVNQHFKTPKEYSDGVSDTAPKLIRRNGQKLRYRRQPYSGNEQLQIVYLLITVEQLLICLNWIIFL